eukprot:SAG22_NODE_2526_length_2475_cov_2.738215_1_plen_317_part_00
MEAMDEAENPLGRGPLAAAAAGLADVEAALAKGGVAPEQAAAAMTAMERLLAERDAKARESVAAMIADAQLGGAGASVRAVVSRLLSAPPANFHQCTVFFLASDAAEDAPQRAKAPLLFLASLAMVLTQTAAALGVFTGTFWPSCATSAHCGRGSYCLLAAISRCKYCGNNIPLPLEVAGACTFGPNRWGGRSTLADASCETRNFPRDPNFAGFNLSMVAETCSVPAAITGLSNDGGPAVYSAAGVASWCETCVHPIDLVVDQTTDDVLIVSNLDAMQLFDIVSDRARLEELALDMLGSFAAFHRGTFAFLSQAAE